MVFSLTFYDGDTKQPNEKQKLLALPEHLTSPQIFNIAFSTH